MEHEMVKVGDNVTLKAMDGSTKCFTVESIVGDVVIINDGRTDKRRVSTARFQEALIAEDTNHSPSITVQLNNLIRVFKLNTNEQVDFGRVTNLTPEEIEVNGEVYKRDQHDFIVLG